MISTCHCTFHLLLLLLLLRLLRLLVFLFLFLLLYLFAVVVRSCGLCFIVVCSFNRSFATVDG